MVNFAMMKTGTVSLFVKYRVESGYANLGSETGIVIEAGAVSPLTSKVACLEAKNVLTDSKCYIKALDKYSNPVESSSSENEGLFRLEATSSGLQSVSGGDAKHQTKNLYEISVPIRVSQAIYTVTADVLGERMQSTSTLRLSSGPVVATHTEISCLDRVPALSMGKCTITGRDKYRNIVPSTQVVAQSFIGVVVDASNGNRIGARVSVSSTIAGGYEMMYRAPERDASLKTSVLYRSNGVSTRIQDITNVTVAAISLDETESKVSCFQKVAVAGDSISCTILAIDNVTKKAIVEAAYARALQAEAKSSSGERVFGEIVPGQGDFVVNFAMMKTGTVSLFVKYRVESGYANLGSETGIVIEAGAVSPLTSKVACLEAKNVLTDSKCYIKALDKYSNPVESSSSENEGLFRLEASSGLQSVSGGDAKHQTKNLYEISVPIRVSQAIYTVTVEVLGERMQSTSTLRLSSGPVVATHTEISCLDRVPALSMGKCTITGRDKYRNIVPSTQVVAQSFIGVVVDASNGNRIGARVSVSSTIAGGYEMMYRAPERDASLKTSVLYRSNGVSTRIQDITNVTVAAISLDETESKVSCFQKVAVAGDSISCTILAIDNVTKKAIVEAAYARALQAEAKSSSGERVFGEIVPGQGDFMVNFAMMKTGTVSLFVKYRVESGYANLGSGDWYSN